MDENAIRVQGTYWIEGVHCEIAWGQTRFWPPLLFSGAQTTGLGCYFPETEWGTWNATLNNPFHSKLLERLTFYKVGHHGSHNATPMSFVDRYVTPHHGTG
jgi:hypothetical protein